MIDKRKIEIIKDKVIEYNRCKNDPIYFIEKYIKNFFFENEPIKLREKQKYIIECLLTKRQIIINGSRQVGKTTVIAWFICWLVTFFENYSVYVLSKKGDSTADLVSEINGYWDTIPDWIKPKKIKDNVLTKEFSNGSKIKGVTIPKGKPEDAGRGMKGGFILIDEVAFFESDISKIYTAIVPVTSYIFKRYEEMGYPYGMALVSTPNGQVGTGEFFFKTWTAALKGEVDLFPIRYHWSDVPEYANDPEWIVNIRRKFPDERDFNQEYELVFLGSKDAFLTDDIINKLQQNNKKPIDSIKLRYGILDLYDELEEDKLYLIGIDTASGYSDDFSAIVITDYDTGVPIAEYVYKLEIEKFKEDISFLINKLELKNFLLIPENVGIGESISQWLDSSYLNQNLYYHERRTKNSSKKPGLSNNGKTRPMMLESMYNTVKNIAEVLYPHKLKLELIALVNKRGKVEAPPGLHDDLAMAYAFTCYVREYGDMNQIRKVLKNNKKSNIKEIKSFISSVYNKRYGT